MAVANYLKCFAVFGLLAMVSLNVSTRPRPEYPLPLGRLASVSADQALERIITGNKRFASGQPQHPHEALRWRYSLEDQQHPHTVVLGCSDSRVPPELIFDQGFGDLFVIRVAGNIVDTDVIASIEYAVDHLDTKLVVVMGHTHCGAVTAAVDDQHRENEPKEIISLVHRIEPAVIDEDGDDRDTAIEKSVVSNVRLSVSQLSQVADLRHAIDNKQVKIVGAVYDMHTGRVRLQDDE